MEDRATWLKAARRKQGMTQEKLAAMASVNVRTVQRAEEGRAMSAEVWKDFEAVLGGGPVLARRRTEEGKVSSFFLKTYKPLKRLRVAKDLLDKMQIASVSKLDYDVEPTAQILPILKKAIEFLECRLPQPWERDQRRYRPATVLRRLEDEAALNGLIEELHGIGASIFYESYWEDIVYPHLDYEGDPFTVPDQKPEARHLLHIVISASDKDRETFPEVQDWGVEVVEREDNDEVPF